MYKVYINYIVIIVAVSNCNTSYSNVYLFAMIVCLPCLHMHLFSTQILYMTVIIILYTLVICCSLLLNTHLVYTYCIKKSWEENS